MAKYYQACTYEELITQWHKNDINMVITDECVYFDEDMVLDDTVRLMKKFIREYEKTQTPTQRGKVIQFAK